MAMGTLPTALAVMRLAFTNTFWVLQQILTLRRHVWMTWSRRATPVSGLPPARGTVDVTLLPLGAPNAGIVRRFGDLLDGPRRLLIRGATLVVT